MKLQEIQKKKKEKKEEKERRRKKKEERERRKMEKVPAYAAVDARQTRKRLNLMSALMSELRQIRAELRRGRVMKWRGWWPFKEEAETTHRKGRKGAGKDHLCCFRRRKG